VWVFLLCGVWGGWGGGGGVRYDASICSNGLKDNLFSKAIELHVCENQRVTWVTSVECYSHG